MKVPVIDQQSVVTSGEAAPFGGPALARPTQGVAQAFGQLAESTGRVANEMLKQEAKAKEEAEAVRLANADLELDTFALRNLHGDGSDKGRIDDAFDGTDTGSGGFLSSQGLDAGKRSADVLDSLHKKREEIAASIEDPEAKAKFLVSSARRMAAYTGQVETHVSKEFEVARSETAKGLVTQQLASSEAGADFWTRTVGAKQVEEHLRALAPTAEAGNAAVAAFKASDAFAFTQGQLAQGNVDDAAAFVENNRETLGSKYAEAKHAVDTKLAATKKDRVNAELAVKVEEWTDAARDDNGFVTENALRQQFEDLPPEDPRRDELQAAFEKNVRRERAKLDAASKKYAGQAELAALVDGRPIPAEAEAHLRKYDPSALVSIREKQRANFRRWKTEKDGSARERAEARRAQGDADKVFLNELETELTNNPGTDPKDFEKQWVARRVEEGEDITAPSDVARSKAGLSASKAVKREDKAETTERRQVAARLERTISAATKVRGKPLDQTQLNERVGRALAMYDQRSAEKGGKALEEADLAALEADLMRSVVTEPGWLGTSIGQKRKLGVDVGASQEPRRMTLPEQTITVDPKQAAAKAWLDAHPDDPRAPAVRRKLGL